MYFIQICVVSSVLTTAGTSVRFLLKPWLQLSNDLSVLSWGKLGRNCYSPKPLRGLLLTQGSTFSMERSRALSWAPKLTSGCCRAPGGLCPPSHDKELCNEEQIKPASTGIFMLLHCSPWSATRVSQEVAQLWAQGMCSLLAAQAFRV